MELLLYSFCPICHLPFDDETHIPRILPCRHTYCVPCLRNNVLSNKAPSAFQCILDNQVFTLKLSDIPYLEKNKDVLIDDALYPSVPDFNETEMKQKKDKMVEEFASGHPQEYQDMVAYIKKHFDSETMYEHGLFKVSDYVDEGNITKLIVFLEAYEQIFNSYPNAYRILRSRIKERLIYEITRSLEGYKKKLFVAYYENILLKLDIND